MRRAAVLGLVLVAAFATPALAQSFVGDWKATAHLQGGAESSETLHVTKTADGYAVEGKAIDAPEGSPQAGPGAEIMLDGNNFAYKRTLVLGDMSIVITYAGVVAGDTFAGTAKLGDTTVSYTGVRIGAAK